MRKNMDFQECESMRKKWKISGDHSKFDWKSRGSTSKKSISSTGRGVKIFFMEKPNVSAIIFNKSSIMFVIFSSGSDIYYITYGP